MTIHPLTRREQEVCNKLCLGWSNQEIATQLGISHRTVEDHRFHILKKFKARNIVEVVRRVYRIGETAA